MIIRKAYIAMEKAQRMIDESLESSSLRLKATSFTRTRKLGAKRILQVILYRIYQSLQLHLDKCFEIYGGECVSKQAFSKARQKLNHEYVREFFDMTAEIAAADNSAATYKGMRLIAIDGTCIALENTPALKKEFGCSGPNNSAATALGSIAYDPLNHAIYDCRLDEYKADERDLARLHVARLNGLGLRGSLLVFDRWYPSAEFIAFLYNQGYQFVMRARSKWNLKADAVTTQGKTTVHYEGQDYPVRVLKVPLATGEVETLITSLNQKQLPIREAGELYFKRWGIETSYDLIKSKLQLENFSGKTVVSIYQDFYATMFIANMASFIADAADEQIATADSKKSLKYPRRANRNYTIGKFRNIFLQCIIEKDSDIRNRMLSKLVADIAHHPISVVPNRSPERRTPRKKRFHIARKFVV